MSTTLEKENPETLALPLGAIPVAFSTLRVYLAENQAGDDPPVPMVIDGCGEWVEAKARVIGGFGFSLAMILPGATDERLATAIRLMSALAKAAYQVRPELCVAVATKIGPRKSRERAHSGTAVDASGGSLIRRPPSV